LDSVRLRQEKREGKKMRRLRKGARDLKLHIGFGENKLRKKRKRGGKTREERKAFAAVGHAGTGRGEREQLLRGL